MLDLIAYWSLGLLVGGIFLAVLARTLDIYFARKGWYWDCKVLDYSKRRGDDL